MEIFDVMAGRNLDLTPLRDNEWEFFIDGGNNCWKDPKTKKMYNTILALSIQAKRDQKKPTGEDMVG